MFAHEQGVGMKVPFSRQKKKGDICSDTDNVRS
jgi:hypothetical protein